ncbi:MAG: VOC family protein, partial [Pseudomonadota bacterium]
MTLSVLETVLYADNLDAAQAFYCDVVGLTLISRHPTRQVFFRHGSGVLLIFAPSVSS